jgi:hypothetical protein
MRTNPWHSAKPGARPVYHDETRCTEGNNIETQYRRDGTGGHRKCEHCTRIQAGGN